MVKESKLRKIVDTVANLTLGVGSFSPIVYYAGFKGSEMVNEINMMDSSDKPLLFMIWGVGVGMMVALGTAAFKNSAANIYEMVKHKDYKIHGIDLYL